MNLHEQYEEKFNGVGAVKADESWQRCAQPVDEGRLIRNRYEYSVGHLYGDVLDVGCGDGFGAHLMLQNSNVRRVFCFDVQDEALRHARQNLGDDDRVIFVKGYGEQMPFFNRRFDCVHCGHTLEHVFDDRAVLCEIARVVKGLIVVSVPLNGGINRRHVREYDREGFLRLVREWFTILEIKVFPRSENIESLVTVLWKN